ncbi:hypothetical protein [Arthrobacter russicus]|jgi:hypothetical protein|uniref:Uncharacterized protein n=1 Tax=Arthrobacter russicus TaxID=172040 RepID=A0ABU1J9X0_9MICC|nr:hypothetical protein [Arthrobacter russicus]MDR6269228.1 hypothetical protein [Arthrobacter russicus]
MLVSLFRDSWKGLLMGTAESPRNPADGAVSDRMSGLRSRDVRSLAATMESLAEDLDSTSGRLGRGIAGCAWAGPDAAGFRERWAGRQRPALGLAAADLRRHAENLLGQAAEQEYTSRARVLAQSGTDRNVEGPNGFLPTAAPWDGSATPAPRGPGDGTAPQPRHAMQNIAAAGRQAAADQVYLAGMLARMARGEPVPVSALAAAKLLAAQAAAEFSTVLASGGAAEPISSSLPQLGEPLPVSANRAGIPSSRTPRTVSDLLKLTTDAYALTGRPGTLEGALRITWVSAAGGRGRYIVSIPGTQQWATVGNPSAFGMRGNLVTASGQRSVLSQAVIDAVGATVPPGSELLLTGHSQGGMTAMNLAADPAALAGYQLTHVVVYGSPVDNDRPDPGVTVLAFEHANDVVPKTDLGGLLSSGLRHPLPSNLHKIQLPDPPGVDRLDVAGNHQPGGYTASVQAMEDSPGAAGLFGVPSLADYLGGDPAETSAVDVPVRSRIRH